MDGFHQVFCRVVFSALHRGVFLVHFSPGLSPCTLWQRKFPWAISYGCFRALFCSKLLCALSCRGLFRALFLRAFIPRTLLQYKFPRVHQRWIFRTLLCSDLLRALFCIDFFRALLCRGFFRVFLRIGLRVRSFAGARSFCVLFSKCFFRGLFCETFLIRFFVGPF